MADGKWTLVMRREYPPFFAFLIGSAISKMYNKLICEYKKGICFWHITIETKKNHGKEICEKWIKENNIKKLYSTNIEEFDKSCSIVKEIMNSYMSLKLKNNININNQIETLQIVLTEYIKIFRTIYSPYYFAEDAIAKIISKINKYPEASITNFNSIQYAVILANIGCLTISDIIPEHVKALNELLNLAIKIRSNAQKELINSIITRCKNYVELIRNSNNIITIINAEAENCIIDYLKSHPDVIDYAKQFGWITTGWHTGKRITPAEIAKKCANYILGSPQPEILKAQQDLLYFTLGEKRKECINKFIEKGHEIGIDFTKEGLKYADLMLYDGLRREARRIVVAKIDYLAYELFQDIAQQIKLSDPDDLYFLSPEELISSLKNNCCVINTSILQERKKGMLFSFEYNEGNDKFISTVIEDQNEISKIVNSCKIKSPNILLPIKGKIYAKWEPFNPIKGKPLILETVNDLQKIDKDTIIISEMIEPQHSIFLDNIKGIITEDGHPSCHAVHVATGKNIPLITSAEGILEWIRAKEMPYEFNKPEFMITMMPNGIITIE